MQTCSHATRRQTLYERFRAVLLDVIEWLRAQAPDVDAIGLGPAGIVEWPADRIVWAPNNA